MPRELTSSSPEPEYAQKALAAIQEEQRVASERIKGKALQVTEELIDWEMAVAKGDVQIVEYTKNGEPYTLDGKRYLYENAASHKAILASLESVVGKQESKGGLALAIVGRGNAKPMKMAKGKVVAGETEIEVFEEGE